MDANFWHEKWKINETHFHEKDTNPGLVKFFPKLSLRKNSRVFIPLCGKTNDIGWLLSQGHRVAGAELVEMAIEQLFSELKIKPKISKRGDGKHYTANHIDIFVGDIFHLNKNILGQVDAIYDRAALVALPKDVRKKYTAHLREITNTAPQLLLSFEYDQTLMDGPPFSVSNEEVKDHYKHNYELTHLESADIPGGLKGKCPAKENIWLLKNN